MKYGYIRVSTHTQAEHGTSLETQREIVKQAGAERVIEDAGKSGKNLEREGIQILQLALREGDSVIVASLDRLGRSAADMATLIQQWSKEGVNLIAIKEGIDTSTSTGTLIAHIYSAVAQQERERILERTAAGRAKARANGKIPNRPRSYPDSKALRALQMRKDGWKIDDIAARLKTSHAGVYRMMERGRIVINETVEASK